MLCGIASFAQSKRNWVGRKGSGEGGMVSGWREDVPHPVYICVVCSCRKSICITIEVFNVPECGLFGVNCLHLHFRICHMKRCSRLFSHVYGMCWRTEIKCDVHGIFAPSIHTYELAS